MPQKPDAKSDDDFVQKLKEGVLQGLAAANADGGAASDARREERYKHYKPLYAGITPPALNEDGSLVDPDAGPPSPPKSGKKKKKKKKKK